MMIRLLRPQPSSPRKSITVLVVEDEPLLAYELSDELSILGHETVGPVMSGRDVPTVLDERPVDFALVDVDLLDGPTGIEVGFNLRSLGIPYAFLTGTPGRLPYDFAGALGVITKPYASRGLREAVAYLCAVAAGGSEKGDVQPMSLLTPKQRNSLPGHERVVQGGGR